MPIQAIFCNPGLSIARLGGSSVPMDAFAWSMSEDPHNAGETRIVPDWTLDVQADASVVPRFPRQVVLRDAGELRPVAPFVEVWCDVGADGQPEDWERVPLTPTVLAADGLNVANLTFTFEAMNFKAARRTGNPALRYGTFPPAQIFGDQHAPQRLMAVSPPTAGASAMIPQGRHIDLGRVQVIRPTPQPAPGTTAWDADVRVDVIRIRFTPARGEFYGPAALAGAGVTIDGVFHPVVPEPNAFLADGAGWLGALGLRAPIVPADTFDGAEQSDGRSLGIVDDTCELRIIASLDRTVVGRPALEAHANVFSGPPDYAPDRRPFLSLADALNDRAAPAAIAERDGQLDGPSRDRWVEDLFERTYETLSLLNVDVWRAARASRLQGDQLREQPIAGDRYPDSERAIGGRDALRDPNIALEAPSEQVPLPLSERARERHRALSDILALQSFVLENPDRLAALLRAPFTEGANESPGATTMQMPPFMRGSNAQPLTLAQWQYDLVMAWRDAVVAGPREAVAFASRAAADRGRRAMERRSAVLARLDRT